MEITIKKWGNSLALRLPRSTTQKYALKSGSKVSMSEEKRGIIFRPVTKKCPSLKELVDMITPKNIHKETDWGKPQGKEIW